MNDARRIECLVHDFLAAVKERQLSETAVQSQLTGLVREEYERGRAEGQQERVALQTLALAVLHRAGVCTTDFEDVDVYVELGSAVKTELKLNACWSAMEQFIERYTKLETKALASQLLSVQQDCIEIQSKYERLAAAARAYRAQHRSVRSLFELNLDAALEASSK